MNVYPIDKPVISIPRVRIKAQTKSYDGSSMEESYIPTATKLIRAGVVNVDVVPSSATNVFVATGLSPDNLKMNRRYTLVTKMNITEDPLGTPVSHEVDLNIRPDNRNQISAEFTFQDSTTADVTVTMQGHVDYEKGIIVYQALFTGGGGNDFQCDSARFSLRFTPVATMNGRTKVIVETEMTDVFVDPNEDFLIDLTEED